MTTSVLIHFKDTVDVKNHLQSLGVEYQQVNDELDVIVDDVAYTVNGTIYQDPDEQFCEHYGIDYDQVNCIELAD